MGINPTQPNHKAFTFDGTSSRNYGVYITGEAVFNAPQRDVQMVDIPGRNGAYALDKGNFNNITVKYPASIVADNATDFAEAVSDLRNFLCSKTGYCRLEDEYNPDEYRMAIYKSGLEVSHDMLTAGEFDITFECKPQRWLKSGETAVTLVSGNDITNPTLFDAHPQLQVYGYGDINVGGDVISVDNATYGLIQVAVPKTATTTGVSQTLNLVDLNNGDEIYVSGAEFEVDYKANSNTRISSLTAESVPSGVSFSKSGGSSAMAAKIAFDPVIFNKNTTSTITKTVTIKIIVQYNGNTTSTNVNITCELNYNGASKITYDLSMSPSSVSHLTRTRLITCPAIFGNSTKSILGNPVYIDLDIGECWNADSGTPVPVNNAVSLPAELPTLPSGNTTITFDNTFTQVDIVPRWWIV